MLYKKYKQGFTLIELLIVTGIIAVMAAIVLALLGGARDKGVDAAVKANLKNAINQAEVFYNTNTASPSSYTGVCTDPGPVGGAKTIAANVAAAGKATGLASPYFSRNPSSPGGTLTTATCNDSGTAWAAEVPLNTSGQMWCVDSTGKSKQTSASIGLTYVCP